MFSTLRSRLVKIQFLLKPIWSIELALNEFGTNEPRWTKSWGKKILTLKFWFTWCCPWRRMKFRWFFNVFTTRSTVSWLNSAKYLGNQLCGYKTTWYLSKSNSRIFRAVLDELHLYLLTHIVIWNATEMTVGISSFMNSWWSKILAVRWDFIYSFRLHLKLFI